MIVAASLQALFLFYAKPAAAVSRILDRGRLWFAIVAAAAVSILLHAPDLPPRVSGSALLRWISFAPGAWLSPLVIVAAVMVPAIILVRSFSGFGGFGFLMSSDYAPLLLCVLTAWAAAYLPLAVARFASSAEILFDPAAFLVFDAYFVVLVIVAVRTIYGIGVPASIGVTALGWLCGLAGMALLDIFGPLLAWFASPLVLIYIYFVFGSQLRSLGQSLQNRQHFQRQLEIATTNPHDADAHYQLGLVYQQRRQVSEAVARFERAVEIDPGFADAHYQLGAIARAQNRFDDAIRHLKIAAQLDDRLSQNEVWRELGAAYLAASQFEEASAALEKFTDRRPYDPEGLYCYGKALQAAGHPSEARNVFERVIEAVRTMPPHRRAQVRRWGGRAKSELR